MKLINLKSLMFINIMVIIFSVIRVSDVYAYGDKQIAVVGGGYYSLYTDYEVQNQYIEGDYLYIEGFYIVKQLQNFITTDGAGRTHDYQLELGGRIYNDIGGYYVDLTTIDHTQGWQWATSGEGDIAVPGQLKNYRLRDVGFRFRIPLSDLTSFVGSSKGYQMKLIVNCYNTMSGKGALIKFTQNKVFSSKNLSYLDYRGYTVDFETNLSAAQAEISASPAYVRTSPSKADYSNIATYNGTRIYWRYLSQFYNFSYASFNSAEKITWYYVQYGPPTASNGKYWVSYSGSSGMYGWIPSIFLTNLTGTPYVIRLYNDAPTINGGNKTVTEGTYVTDGVLLSGMSATDSEDGNITNRILITNRGGLNGGIPGKAGNYTVSYQVTDNNGVPTSKSITLSIVNVPPTINASNKVIEHGSTVTNAMLMEGVTASDPYDENLTSGIKLTSRIKVVTSIKAKTSL